MSSTVAGPGRFRSAYGPKYFFQPNLHGWNKTALLRLGTRTAAYGGAAGIAALMFTAGIPKIQTDILQKLPIVGKYFVKEQVHPADNPF